MRTYTKTQVKAVEDNTELILVGWYDMGYNVLVPVFKRRRK